eukprot:GDKH01016914.1.p1 GENE.GDKH01016914.1~~GDKH01016914.1.p1  ORF type:complete len:118 (-),score=24.54 GDKH01016914.1:80-388(-)
MECKDPRILYQLIHWVESKGEELRADVLVDVVEIFDVIGIQESKAWKTIVHRAGKKGVELPLKEMKKLQHLIRKNGFSTDRFEGLIDFYILEKEDQAKSGRA